MVSPALKLILRVAENDSNCRDVAARPFIFLLICACLVTNNSLKVGCNLEIKMSVKSGKLKTTGLLRKTLNLFVTSVVYSYFFIT